MTNPHRVPRAHAFRAAATALFAAALCAAGGAPAARAAAGAPSFSDPLAITHPHMPFSPGAVLVYSGSEGGAPVVSVVRHLPETREFAWQGGTVACRVVETVGFERGRPSGHERVFLAQSGDGAVWSFGEVEDADPTDDGGDDAHEPSGWIVGEAAPGDPDGLVTGAQPSMLLPAALAAGDAWTSEDAGPFFERTSRVVATGRRLRVPAARADDCVRVRDTDLSDGTSETKWYARGIGLVQERSSEGRLTLRAGSLAPRR